MSSQDFDAYNIHDLREIARRKLPRGVFEFIDRGTEDEAALRNNRAVFERIRLRPNNLRDVSGRTLETTLFGRKQSMPLAIAPTGSAGLTWYQGEVAIAKAAAAAGIPFTLATGSTTSMETVAEQAGGELWMQLYMWPDRELSYQLVRRALAAGFKGLLVTVDSPVSPGREYNLHNGFTLPFSVSRKNFFDLASHPGWMTRVLLRYLLTTGLPRYENYPAEIRTKITAVPMGRAMMLNDNLTWDDMRRLRDMWPHKLMAKGVLTGEDAQYAVDAGCDAVIVSNHGGRVVDAAPAPIEMLPEVVGAVGHKTTVIVDSGFRRGSDILKALALGAHAVLVGRATLYGSATGGQAGAARAITLLREEMERNLALIGKRSIADLSPDCLDLYLAPDIRERLERARAGRT